MVDKLLFADECYKIIGLCMQVHRALGCGFWEPVYQEAFEILLKREGVPFEREKELPIYFLGQKLKKQYFADFLCYGKIIVEFKTVSSFTPAHEAQLLNYLKAANLQVGLLCNFAQPSFVYKRYLNPHYQPPTQKSAKSVQSVDESGRTSGGGSNNGLSELSGFGEAVCYGESAKSVKSVVYNGSTSIESNNNGLSELSGFGEAVCSDESAKSDKSVVESGRMGAEGNNNGLSELSGLVDSYDVTKPVR